jgi:hypothetical protein
MEPMTIDNTPSAEWREACARLLEEAGRIVARTKDEVINQAIVADAEFWCRVVPRDDSFLAFLGDLAETRPLEWDLWTHKSRADIIDRPLGNNWRELCLWLEFKATHLMKDAADPALRECIEEQLAVARHSNPGLAIAQRLFNAVAFYWERRCYRKLVIPWNE